MGFRGKLGERSCFKCGVTDENNFDEQGRLHMLKVVSIDKNLNNARPGNHYYSCEHCKNKGFRK